MSPADLRLRMTAPNGRPIDKFGTKIARFKGLQINSSGGRKQLPRRGGGRAVRA